MITENLSTLKIHKLTQTQYNRELANGTIDENALYLTPDEAIDLSGYATVEQLSTKADSSHTHTEYMSTTNPTSTGSFSMNRKSGTAVGDYSHAEGCDTTASAHSSHAEGYSTTASGLSSHAEGENTTASDYYSHAEGYGTTASGISAHAEGHGTTASGICSHAGGYRTIAGNYQYVVGKYSATRTAPTETGQDTTYEDGIFIVGNGTADDESSRTNALRVSSGGRCYSGRFVAGTADFAELFEWSDGNPKDEDRRGLFVALDGEKIKLADADDDYFGVVSGTPAFIGNSASEEWHDKYLTDVFGTRLSQEVVIPEKTDEKTGEVIVPAHTVTQFIINPEYNPDKTYIMRENRKEWDTIGLCGQVVVVDDGTCIAGGYCKPSHDGRGTAADSGYRVMKRIDETHIKVLVK